MKSHKFSLILPTYNAGKLGEYCFAQIRQQTLQPDVIIIDSDSNDNTVEKAAACHFTVHQIPQHEFNHGSTRNLVLKLLNNETEFVIFMTQDALLASEYTLENLIKAFADPYVAAIYGRQLPHDNANPLATHARLFNYPEHSRIKSMQDMTTLGIKTAFISNSFAAYRISTFKELGGFPHNTILAEDMHLAARLILNGYKVAYCAEATVKHSHNYTLWQEFQRYFDTGVFQANENWIQQKFGLASGEGKRFVLSELCYLYQNAPLWIPYACLSTLCKFVGFKLGLNWQKIPAKVRPYLSMHKNYWK